MSIDTTLDPKQQGPDQEFVQYLADGEFKIQLCCECGQHVFYPRLLCSHCGADKLTWTKPSGKGTVYSTSVPRGGKEGDYNIALIDLAEGPRMLSRVEGIAPEKVEIGMAVTAFIGEVDEKPVVLFKPDTTIGGTQ